MTAQNEEKMSPFDSFINRRFQCRFEDLGMVFPCDLDLAWQAAIAQDRIESQKREDELQAELAKYKEAKPIGIFHRHPYATVEWLTGEAIPDKLKLYAHPDNTKE